MLPLFNTYPSLKDSTPHLALGNFPTPVKKLTALGREIGCDSLYLKNDGLSGTSYGGNKLRKLEFLLAEAKHQGCAAVLTYGAAGSNHALATAVYARKAGLACHAVLAPQPNSRTVQNNLLFAQASGSQMHYCNDFSSFGVTAAKVKEEFEGKTGGTIYDIPPGGSSPVGALGYVNAAFELKEQILAGVLPQPDIIYVPLGTAGTAMGLMLGLQAAGIESSIQCIRVVDRDFASPKKMHHLFSQAEEILHKRDGSVPRCSPDPSKWDIRHEFFGNGYGESTPEGAEAISYLESLEGIVLEGTYTAKTCAAVISDGRRGLLKGKTALYWFTYNAVDFSDTIDRDTYRTLPESLQSYFT